MKSTEQTVKGNRVSYEPPRYEYSYDYKVYINVDSPYFNELKLPITTFSVKAEDHNRRHNVERIGYQMVNYLSQFASQGSMGGSAGRHDESSGNGIRTWEECREERTEV